MDTAKFYTEKVNLDKLCNMLRSGKGPTVKEAILRQGEKRVYYLKGEKLLNFLTVPKKGRWDEKLPRLPSREAAFAVCRTLLAKEYLVQVNKESKNDLSISRENTFEEDKYFVWVYEGSATKRKIMTSVLIGAFMMCVCFPLWPQVMKMWVWYISVTCLLFMSALVLARSVLFLFTWGFLG